MMNKLGDKKIKTIITSIYVFNRYFILSSFYINCKKIYSYLDDFFYTP